MSVNLNELDSVLGKVSELKVFFDFGQKTIPILEDLWSFFREIGPGVESVKAMIEVTSARLPKATDQLGRVNQTSEQASNDILNTIDTMMGLIDALSGHQPNTQASDAVAKTGEKVSKQIATLVEKSGWDEDVRELLNVWDLHEQSLKSFDPGAQVKTNLDSLREYCTNIMMALQVQDITGQQISMVIGTLQAIGDVVNNLSEHFSDVAAAKNTESQEEREGDPESIGAENTKRLVESLLQKARSGDSIVLE
jgi:chemotaxis regulatin CheY-phosphate phosphatase CheZ